MRGIICIDIAIVKIAFVNQVLFGKTRTANRDKPDGSTLDALLAKAKRCIVEDQTKQRKHPLRLRYHDMPQPLWLYCSSWIRVESAAELNFPKDLSQEKASQSFRKVADLINRWKKKIDGNLAAKKLNVTFCVDF
jgi:hypothetical protein